MISMNNVYLSVVGADFLWVLFAFHFQKLNILLIMYSAKRQVKLHKSMVEKS